MRATRGESSLRSFAPTSLRLRSRARPARARPRAGLASARTAPMTALLRLLAALAARLPWRALRWVGAVVGWTAGSVLGIRRGHVLRAMRAAQVNRPTQTARAMYRSLGVSAMEFLWLAARAGSAEGHVRLAGEAAAVWDEAMARGRGVVIAASHTGNWDLAACAMAARAPLLVVTKHLSATGLDRFWQEARARR